MELKVIKTREGDLINFDRTRIERVIEKASESVGAFDIHFIEEVTDRVEERLKEIIINSDGTEFITVETVQDQVERELMESGHFEVMKNFIIYRSERIKKREIAKEKVEKKLEKKIFKIKKSD
ncbi:hypothetical protein HOF65_00785 [bacterium]|jgi:anaerobic ribonucleoside-triphosphate reductase|nr:hypothetical protein [bacterium]MBT3852579.1 hypothetical protein [bacterium]